MKRFFYRDKGKFAAWMLLECLAALSMVYWSYFMKNLSDQSDGSRGFQGIQRLLFLGGSFLALYFLISYFCLKCRAWFLRSCTYSLRDELFDRIVHYDINSFNDSNSAKYISILNNDIMAIDEKYFRTIPEIFSNILMAVVAWIAMMLYNPWIALVGLLLDSIQLTAPAVFGKRAAKQQDEYMKSLDHMNAEIKDIFTGFEVVKSFGIEEKIQQKYRKLITSIEEGAYRMRDEHAKATSLSHTCTYLSAALRLIFSVYLVVRGDITFGILMGTMQISNYVSNPIRTVSGLYLNYKTVKPVVARVLSILDGTASEEQRARKEIQIEKATPIQLEELSFSYQKGREILHQISFQFETGKKYAVVGSSGSGKSTLIRMLMAYYDNYSGNIQYAGVPLKDIDKSSLYQHVAMIHQKVFLFEDTLRNNITMYHEYPEEQVWKAVREAGLSGVVERMGQGLDSLVEENGRNLSGGEQQRVAIARAFIKGTKVLIMDEATSSLDNQNAFLIDSLLLQKQGLTLISITHKSSREILAQYDEVLFLEDGILLEHALYHDLSEQRRKLLELHR